MSRSLEAEIPGHALAVEVVHVAEGQPSRHVSHDPQIDAVVRRRVGKQLVHRRAGFGRMPLLGVLEERAADQSAHRMRDEVDPEVLGVTPFSGIGADLLAQPEDELVEPFGESRSAGFAGAEVLGKLHRSSDR